MNVQQYVDALVELAVAGRPAPLKRIVAARVRGEEKPIRVQVGETEREILSPPLERDEPDRNAALTTVYAVLRSAEDPSGLENLRRAVCELLTAGLVRGDDLAYLQNLARLVGHLRVVDSEELWPMLSRQLHGFLESDLDLPFSNLIALRGDALERATLALDVWVAVMPIQPPCQSHHQTKLLALLNTSLETLETGYVVPEPRLRFLFLAFRALVKINPVTAGGAALWRICRLIDRYSTELPHIRRRWLATCRHLGVVLAAHEEWRRAFYRGVCNFQRQRDPAEFRNLPLYRDSLKKLDGLWAEVQSLRRRRRPRARRVTWRTIEGGKS